MKNNFNTVIIYPTGICNLNCRYCGINKNAALKDIDNLLGDSFKGDYYINQIKKYLPRKDMLRRIETWGGEPFIHMDRVHNLVRQVIDYYPYFKEMHSSTNFSYDSWLDQFLGLMNVFGEYPYRNFVYDLQLSVDGPEYINDAGRGEGVTKRCITNFDKLINYLQTSPFPENLQLNISIKGTLDNDTFKKLCNKEQIIEYYQFLEDNFILKVIELNKDNVNIGCCVPNTAVPSPVTVEDGKKFAEFCKLCREVEQENENCRYFKCYRNITPFSNDNTQDMLTYNYNHHTCGTGVSMIGFLPNGMLSTCHEGFTQLVDDYNKFNAMANNDKKSITFDQFIASEKVSMCTNEEGYENFMYKMDKYTTPGTSARLVNNATLITALAMAGQVDPVFLDTTNALKAAIFIQGHAAYCIKDNYHKTGSYMMMPVGMFKLLLNGASNYIQHEGELIAECQTCC